MELESKSVSLCDLVNPTSEGTPYLVCMYVCKSSKSASSIGQESFLSTEEIEDTKAQKPLDLMYIFISQVPWSEEITGWWKPHIFNHSMTFVFGIMIMIITVDWIDLFLSTIPRKKKVCSPLSMWFVVVQNTEYG